MGAGRGQKRRMQSVGNFSVAHSGACCDWAALSEKIPFIQKNSSKDKLHAVEQSIAAGNGWGVSIAQPGKHWDKTEPYGGDFVVKITSRAMGWSEKKFTHDDLFQDLELKRVADKQYVQSY